MKNNKMTKANILAEQTGHHADLLAKDFLNDEAVTPQQAFNAMEEYKSQPNNPLKEIGFAVWVELEGHQIKEMDDTQREVIYKQYLQSLTSKH